MANIKDVVGWEYSDDYTQAQMDNDSIPMVQGSDAAGTLALDKFEKEINGRPGYHIAIDRLSSADILISVEDAIDLAKAILDKEGIKHD